MQILTQNSLSLGFAIGAVTVGSEAVIYLFITVVVFLITLCDYKQLSYWARIVIIMTAIVFIYVMGETLFRFYFLNVPEIKKDLK